MAKEGTLIPITEAQAVLRGKPPQDLSKPLIDQVLAISPIKVGERRFSGTAAGIVRLVTAPDASYALPELSNAIYGDSDEAHLEATKSFITGINLQLERESVKIVHEKLPNGTERVIFTTKQTEPLEVVTEAAATQSEPLSPPSIELEFSPRVTKEKENLRKRDFGGMSTQEISNTIDEVIEDIHMQYPDLSILSFYRMVSSRITQHVSSRVQEEALQAIAGTDAEQAKAGTNTFLFVNLHKILVAIKPYITEDDQSNADTVANAITSVIEGVKTSPDHYGNQLNKLSFIIYNDAQRAAETVIAKDVQLPLTAIHNKAYKEIFQRAGEYAAGYELSEEALQELSKRAGISEKTLEDYFADYNLLQKEQTTNREWEENPSEKAVTQHVLREQIYGLLVLDTITTRERDVLILRFGLADGTERTLEEVGRVIGTKRERPRQIEAKALRKLRHPLRAAKIKDYWVEEGMYRSKRSKAKKDILEPQIQQTENIEEAERNSMFSLTKDSPFYNLSIGSLDLSKKNRVALWLAGVTTIGQLIEKTDEELGKIRFLGGKGAVEIREKFEQFLQREKTQQSPKP